MTCKQRSWFRMQYEMCYWVGHFKNTLKKPMQTFTTFKTKNQTSSPLQDK